MAISQISLIRIFRKTNGKCFYCKKNGEVIDHFISKQKWKEWDLTPWIGSVDKIDNLFLSCRKCNSSKSNKCPEDFIGNSEKAWKMYDKVNKKIGINNK